MRRASQRGRLEQVDELRPHVHLILVDAALDDVDDLVGIRGEHRPRNDVQRRVHHRAGDVDLAPVGKRIPFIDELLRDLGHDRRIAGDAARIERWRHDAPMATPGFAFGGEQAAAEPGLEQAARQLGLDVVGSVVEEHVPDGARLVDDDGAPPQQPAHQDVGVEILRRKRRKRVVAKHAQELTEAQAALRQPRRGKDGGFAAIDDAHGPCLTLKRRCREHRRYSPNSSHLRRRRRRPLLPQPRRPRPNGCGPLSPQSTRICHETSPPYLRPASQAGYNGTMGNEGPMQPRVRDTGRGRGARPFFIVVAAAALPLLPGCSSIISSSAPSASSVRTSADAAPAPDSGTTVGSLRQSYIGFLNAFRDPADQTPATPPPNPPAAAGRVGPAAASGPATVAAAPPSDPQSFRPVPPGYYTPSAPPYKPPE